MSFKIVLYTPQHETLVQQFNKRLSTAGIRSRFPESAKPQWLPASEGRRIFQEYYLCLEGEFVRGAYILKRQQFQIAGRDVTIGNFQLPISEGIADRKFGMIGVTLLRDALIKEPLLYCLGLGGYEEAISKLLSLSGWKMFSVPFYFRINSPYRFLRKIRFLRRTFPRRIVLDLAAFTGVGWAITKIAQSRFMPTTADSQFEVKEVSSFQNWADVIWEDCKGECLFQAVRDRETLDILYPETDRRFHKLVIWNNEEAVGWCVLMATKMTSHKQFGDLSVGSIVDLLCPLEIAEFLARYAAKYFAKQGTDLIVTNQSSGVIGAALRRAGFLSGPSNFILALSPQLAKEFAPLETNFSKFHFNRGDGDGPIHI